MTFAYFIYLMHEDLWQKNEYPLVQVGLNNTKDKWY
jgi:hypothetical protein